MLEANRDYCTCAAAHHLETSGGGLARHNSCRWGWSIRTALFLEHFGWLHAGMICPHIVNVSMMLGAIITWGFLWPFIASKAGEWYPADLNEHNFSGLFGYKVLPPCYGFCHFPVSHHCLQHYHNGAVSMFLEQCRQAGTSSSTSQQFESQAGKMHGVQGDAWGVAQVFIAMAVFLGDGLYNFTKIAIVSILSIKATTASARQSQRSAQDEESGVPCSPSGAGAAPKAAPGSPSGSEEPGSPQLRGEAAGPAARPRIPARGRSLVRACLVTSLLGGRGCSSGQQGHVVGQHVCLHSRLVAAILFLWGLNGISLINMALPIRLCEARQGPQNIRAKSDWKGIALPCVQVGGRGGLPAAGHRRRRRRAAAVPGGPLVHGRRGLPLRARLLCASLLSVLSPISAAVWLHRQKSQEPSCACGHRGQEQALHDSLRMAAHAVGNADGCRVYRLTTMAAGAGGPSFCESHLTSRDATRWRTRTALA